MAVLWGIFLTNGTSLNDLAARTEENKVIAGESKFTYEPFTYKDIERHLLNTPNLAYYGDLTEYFAMPLAEFWEGYGHNFDFENADDVRLNCFYSNSKNM